MGSGQVVPLQPGIAALAAQSGLPVLPVATDSGLCWSRRAFIKRPGTIHIDIAPPIPPGLRRGPLLAAIRAGWGVKEQQRNGDEAVDKVVGSVNRIGDDRA